MTQTPNERSGSRWEPDASEQRTENLSQATEVIPGMHDEVAAKPKRRLPKVAGAVAIVAAATIAGGAAGMALAGNQTQQVNDTAVTTDTTDTTDTTITPQQQPYSDPDGDRFGGHFGHGPGGHR